MSNNNSMRRRGPMGGRRGMAPGEKAKDLKGTMIKLIKYMRRFYLPIVIDRKSTRLNSSHASKSRMPSSA